MPAFLLDLLRAHARRAPGAECLRFGEERLTFGDLDRRSSQVAQALAASGVQRGDRVAILAHTSPVFYELAFGCAKHGAIMMPLNWRLSAREVAGIVADGAPRLALVGSELCGLLAEVQGTLPIVALGPDYAAWRDGAGPIDPPALLLYTSGTTGQPKGVIVSHGNLGFVEPTANLWKFGAGSVNLVAMPLFHIGGIGYGMMALSRGGRTVLLPQPEPRAVLAAMAAQSVTHAFFVPTVIQRLVEQVEQDRSTPGGMELIVYGGAPIGEALLRRAIAAFHCGFAHAYGMTETSGTVISLMPEEHHPEGPGASRLRSCGRPFPWVEFGLVDPATGAPVAQGQVGEIRVRGPMNTPGYWNRPAETAAAFDAGGWLRTGDAAWCDQDGYVYVHDRYKDLIVSGGENIYPAEVENVLLTHPAVIEVAVIGVAHPVWGETPRAFVVLRESMTAGEDELIAFARQHLARYKCPTSVRIVRALPRNPSGKVLRRELRRWVQEDATQGGAAAGA
jgi:acyl-CoA synthetase (AMP-forming)/AMP-acid ligase II